MREIGEMDCRHLPICYGIAALRHTPKSLILEIDGNLCSDSDCQIHIVNHDIEIDMPFRFNV